MTDTVENILGRIGSRAEIACECNVEPIAVYRWAKSGRIPSQHLPGVLRVAQRNSAGVDASDLIAAHGASSPVSDAPQKEAS